MLSLKRVNPSCFYLVAYLGALCIWVVSNYNNDSTEKVSFEIQNDEKNQKIQLFMEDQFSANLMA